VSQLSEFLNSGTGDYALLAPSESLPGYNPQPLTAYGYRRFGNASEVLLSLSAGGVTVQSNEVAGGATWRWFWNGVQFLNHADYGREIQAAFYYGTTPDLNPNEAGDGLTFNFLDPSYQARFSGPAISKPGDNPDHARGVFKLGPNRLRRRSGPSRDLGQSGTRKRPDAPCACVTKSEPIFTRHSLRLDVL
jgi:hypothetical protein